MKKALDRAPHFRATVQKDFVLIYGAYGQGAWPGLFPDGLDRDEFEAEFLRVMDQYQLFTMLAQTVKGLIPVGVISVAISGKRLEPHFGWFPWASGRNKLESVLGFVAKVRESRTDNGLPYKALIWADEQSTGFFEHIKRYGILSGGGRVHSFFDDGSNAILYYSRDLK